MNITWQQQQHKMKQTQVIEQLFFGHRLRSDCLFTESRLEVCSAFACGLTTTHQVVSGGLWTSPQCAPPLLVSCAFACGLWLVGNTSGTPMVASVTCGLWLCLWLVDNTSPCLWLVALLVACGLWLVDNTSGIPRVASVSSILLMVEFL